MSELLKWFDENKDRIHEIFKTLHSMPEPGFNEFKTSDFLAGELGHCGYEVRRDFAGTAVLGVKRGRETGPCVCLRGEMDALTFTIDGETRHIHACGHDANCTEVLSAAIAAAETGFPERGTLIILFQPCEEGMKGAKAVIESGALTGVDYMFATHLRPAAEMRRGACPAVLHGAMTLAELKVHGKSAHGARPHEGVNAAIAAARIVDGVSRVDTSGGAPCSMKATRIITGDGSLNIIPAECCVYFDMRAQTNERMDALKARLSEIAQTAAGEMGAAVELSYIGGVPAAIPSKEAEEHARTAIMRVFGAALYHPPITTAGGEDFHYYPLLMPGVRTTVFGFGADMKDGLHNPNMSFDDSILPTAAKTLAAAVEDILK